jgi:hypothetical protein
MTISYYIHAKEVDNSTEMQLDDFLGKIKTGFWEDAVIDVRKRLANAKTRAERNNIKVKLPNATISGTFSKRTNDGLVQHSGFIAIDFDNLDNVDEVFSNLTGDNYIYSLFRSVSGQGLCAILKIDPEKHQIAYTGAEYYFKTHYNYQVDPACKNVSRGRIISHDPDLYINKAAKTFEIEAPKPDSEKQEHVYDNKRIEVTFSYIEKNKIDLTDSYDDWMHLGLALASEFKEDGRDFFHRISAVNEKYDRVECDKKYDNFLKSGRGDVTMGTFYHYCTLRNIPTPIIQRDNKFWFVTGSSEKKELDIDQLNFNHFLIDNGFCKYYISNGYIFVRRVNNIVTVTTPAKIKDYVISYVKSIKHAVASYDVKGQDRKFYPSDLKRVIIKKSLTLFKVDKLEFLPTIDEQEFVKGYKDKNFFFFLNGFVHINYEKWQFHTYKDMDKCIWAEQIINREFTLTTMIDDFDDCVFYNFLRKVCQSGEEKLSDEKLAMLMTITGYLLHNYEGGKRKAVFLTDENKEDDVLDGRTGKTLYSESMAHLKNICVIDGKGFKYDQQFKFQKADLATQIILINDITARFRIENFFHSITESVSVEKKNRDVFEISPKFIFTSNKTLPGLGGSYRDRLIEFEFNNYFSDRHTPYKEFGHWFFVDWDEEEWMKFYNFMFTCCIIYLNKLKNNPDSSGIHEVSTGNMELKKLIANTNKDFYLFMEDCFINKVYETENINKSSSQMDFSEAVGIGFDRQMDVKALFDFFLQKFTDSDSKFIKQRSFTNWLTRYANFANYEIVLERKSGKAFVTVKNNENGTNENNQ